jgi:hypothetical protein
MVSEDETKEKFEKKIVTPIKAATARMKHAKKIMPEITPILTKFHEKVSSKSSLTFNSALHRRNLDPSRFVTMVVVLALHERACLDKLSAKPKSSDVEK